MNIEITKVTDWKRVYESALFTMGKKPKQGAEPSDEWKLKILRAEHSPIRLLEFDIKIYGIPSWVATHFVRHHIGVEKFVVTQRTDRTGIDRDNLPQGALVDLWLTCNAQALINISRKRLCNKASKETRNVWRLVKTEIGIIDPAMAEAMLPDCLYRGKCCEMFSCRDKK